jgi:lipopolysaccharide transport system permease protein
MVAGGLNRWLYYGRLVQALALRDIQTRFANSALGLSWLVIRPTIFMLVFSVLRGALQLPDDGLPYALSSYVAISGWFFFITILSGATPSIQTNAGILKKMAVPRILFPISAVFVGIVEYVVTWIPLVALLIWFNWPLSWTLIYLPLLLMIVMLFGLGLGLLLSSIAVFKDDVLLALPHVIMLWFFLTPVIYPATRLPPDYLWLYHVNPMTGPIEAFRDVILRGTPLDWTTMLPIAIATLAIWALAVPVFNFMSRYFADAL